MKYDVDWQPAALQALAAIWNVAADKDTVRQAADEIDRQLAQVADALGESRDENFRVQLLSPLGVEFQIFPADGRAFVVRVWRFDPRPRP